MKVLYISNGLTHYYNFVLSRLNAEPEVELTAVIPTRRGANIGAGVHQTREGVNFRVIELEETRLLRLYSTFKGLGTVLLTERPDVIITIGSYLHAFLFDLRVVLARRRIHAGLVLKDIPFRLLSYGEARRALEDAPVGFSSLPVFVNRLLVAIGLVRQIRRIILDTYKSALARPDAHVNYIEAHDLWATYGIPREKIFVTRNSPDTDMLFDIKDSLTGRAPVLPSNPFRLMHVGRLVEWKRVDMLLRSFARLLVHFPSAELLVIGSGPEEGALRQLADDLGIRDRVTFTGGVYDPLLLGQYFLASSLYVMAGMGGLSINEAMCYGLPVLCSVCDGTEKVLVREGVNGRYFRDNDEDDLLEKIRWFFEHPDDSRRMGRHSEEIIRNEVNIQTVIDGYVRAIAFAAKRAEEAAS